MQLLQKMQQLNLFNFGTSWGGGVQIVPSLGV